jgi:hypothetical protein
MANTRNGKHNMAHTASTGKKNSDAETYNVFERNHTMAFSLFNGAIFRAKLCLLFKIFESLVKRVADYRKKAEKKRREKRKN